MIKSVIGSIIGGVFAMQRNQTYKKRMMPVLDMAYAKPRIPLPMMALPRLKTDMPKEVFPSN